MNSPDDALEEGEQQEPINGHFEHQVAEDASEDEYRREWERRERQRLWKNDWLIVRIALLIWIGVIGVRTVEMLDDPGSLSDWSSSMIYALISITPHVFIFVPIWLALLRYKASFAIQFAVSAATFVVAAFIAQVLFNFAFGYEFDVVDGLSYGVYGAFIPLVHLIITKILKSPT